MIWQLKKWWRRDNKNGKSIFTCSMQNVPDQLWWVMAWIRNISVHHFKWVEIFPVHVQSVTFVPDSTEKSKLGRSCTHRVFPSKTVARLNIYPRNTNFSFEEVLSKMSWHNMFRVSNWFRATRRNSFFSLSRHRMSVLLIFSMSSLLVVTISIWRLSANRASILFSKQNFEKVVHQTDGGDNETACAFSQRHAIVVIWHFLPKLLSLNIHSKNEASAVCL